MLSHLAARTHDDLLWEIKEGTTLFEFDLGLNDPYFSLEDELHFNALARALSHFHETVFPNHPNCSAVLYRGPADFSRYFLWTELQRANFERWKEEMPALSESHLKRLFCASSFVHYFQMLAHKLPDEMPIKIILDPSDCGTLAETLHLLSPERFEHFDLESGLESTSNIGVCFPPDEECCPAVLEQIDALLKRLPSYRAVYEPLLREQWEGLDELYVVSRAVTEQGKRKLLGFEAAGGKIIES
jgi:hypothetical protein